MTTDDIESYFGSIEKVAAFFGITTEAVYQWRNRPGQLIPKDVQQKLHIELADGCHLNLSFMKNLMDKSINRNHRTMRLTVGKHHWKVEKQPEWYVKAVRKTIAALPGGYAEAADWLDVTENALFNRLRADGDQIFPLGWAMILQRAGGTHFIADAVAQAANGVFVSLPDVEDVDNADINQRLLEVIEQIGSYSRQIRSAIEDGVVEPHEKTAINDELYLSISKLQEHAALVYKIFCISESNDARECAAPGAVACRDCGETNA